MKTCLIWGLLGKYPRAAWTKTAGLVLLCGAGLVSCRQQQTPRDSQHRHTNAISRLALKSTADVRRLLVAGMSTNQITSLIGEPDWALELERGSVLWHYAVSPFPASDEMAGTYVTRVGLTITNGYLAFVGFSYAELQVPPPEHALPPALPHSESPSLKFFVVSKEPIPGGKYIDSGLFPRLGFVAPTPTLAIVALKEVTWTEETVATPEGRSQTNWTFRISLQPEDAPRLKAMTTDNLSKQMLMVVGEVSVSAPIIRDPVEEGIMEFKCRDPRIAESAKKHLARMKRGQ